MDPRAAGDSTPIKMSESVEKRRKKKICLLVMAVIVVVSVVIVILGLTVFKARDPKVQINTINLETFSIRARSLNMSLLLDLTVHNPNREVFEYTGGVTRLFYYGDPVGQTRLPAGYSFPAACDFLCRICTFILIQFSNDLKDIFLLSIAVLLQEIKPIILRYSYQKVPV